MADENLDNGRETLAAIAAYRVDSIDLRSISTWRLPGEVQIIRESLLWRAEELAQNAFDALDADRFVASAVAARAVMETTAAIFFLCTLTRKAIDEGVSETLIAKIERFLINSKIWEELDDPIHINDMLREVEKVIPGFMETTYASLSERAHPNWSGTFGAFGAFDKEKVLAIFMQGGRSPDNQRRSISLNLAATLGLAKGYYERIGADLDAFVKAAEAYYAKYPPTRTQPK
jgi:hypothetical protein